MRTELQFQVKIAVEKAIAVERKGIASAMCHDCRRGHMPTYDSSVNHYYHNLGDGEQIGCSASIVHRRIRNRN